MDSRWDFSYLNLNNTNPLINFLDDSPTGALDGELNRITSENKKLVENIVVLNKKYASLQEQVKHLMTKNLEKDQINIQLKKRKANSEDYVNMNNRDNRNSEGSNSEDDSCRRTIESNKSNISRVHYRVDASDASLVVKDGYQWRKYGQKVTKDNPFPRAYFKCSFAPSCPVKKKVQRSAEYPSVVVATYQGKHNHLKPCQAGLSLSTGHSSDLVNMPTSISPLRPLAPLVALDLIQDDNDAKNLVQGCDAHEIKQILIQQMASSLTSDPNFTAALAAAISGTVLS